MGEHSVERTGKLADLRVRVAHFNTSGQVAGGDATLDGKLNIDDYGRIDANINKSGVVDDTDSEGAPAPGR